jgi:AcrR family transcriptional regulator
MAAVDDIAKRVAGLGRPPDELSLDEIAAAVGMSRSTLIRRIGDRATLDAALRERGVAGAGRPSAADRAIDAAARLYAERGVGRVSLDDVAATAGCTVQAIYGGIGGRDALLVAVAERYSPMPEVSRFLADPPDDLATGARTLYGLIMDAVSGDPPVVPVLAAEMLARPDGPLADYVRTTYAPRAGALLRGWLEPFARSGRIRPLPPATLVSLFTGPLLVFNLMRLNAPALAGPERRVVVSEFADAFVRSVTV